MSKEITVIYRDGSDVGLGVLDQVGRRFYHIRFIKNAGQGGTELAEKAIEIPIGDVEIVDGYDYLSLIAFQDRNRAVLDWRGRRQAAFYATRLEAMEGVERKVLTTMRKWDKENPEPPSITFELLVAPAVVHEAINQAILEPGFVDELNYCGVCEMLDGCHAVDCSNALPDDDEGPEQCSHGVPMDECAYPHDNGKEPLPEDEQDPLADFRRPADAPTEEAAQETAVGADDVDVPF